MWRRLRLAFARHDGWLWRQGRRVRGWLGHRTAKTERATEDRRHSDERARFWAEFREGERQAEAHCARSDP